MHGHVQLIEPQFTHVRDAYCSACDIGASSSHPHHSFQKFTVQFHYNIAVGFCLPSNTCIMAMFYWRTTATQQAEIKLTISRLIDLAHE